jgi:chromosome segregation ATPase
MQADMAKRDADLLECREDLEAKEGQIRALQEKDVAHNSAFFKMELTLAQKDAEIRSQLEALSAREAACDVLRESLGRADAERHGLLEGLSSSKADVATLQQTVAAYEKVIATFQAERDAHAVAAQQVAKLHQRETDALRNEYEAQLRALQEALDSETQRSREFVKSLVSREEESGAKALTNFQQASFL